MKLIPWKRYPGNYNIYASKPVLLGFSQGSQSYSKQVIFGGASMSKRRQEKMSEEIKRTVSHVFQEGIKDPRIDQAAISITRVDLSNDMSHARINLSILGDQAKQEEMMNAVKTARGYIRTELARRLKVKHAPEIEFRLDKSIEHGIRISSILEELKDEQKS